MGWSATHARSDFLIWQCEVSAATAHLPVDDIAREFAEPHVINAHAAGVDIHSLTDTLGLCMVAIVSATR